MKKSRVCALGLACFLGAVTAFSALAATSGGGAFLRNLSDKNALSSAFSQGSRAGQNAGQNASGAATNLTPEEQLAAEMQADLLAGTLELDPENDPILGTTESGIEIKYHNATTTTLTGNWDYTAFTKNYFLGNSIASGTFYNLSGYLYITMGGYNWIIIGRNSSLTTMSLTNTYNQGTATPTEFIKFASYNTYANSLKGQTETTTDAGSVINSANANGIVNTVTGVTRTYSYTLSSYGAPVATTEIPSGCVLCLSAAKINEVYFDDTTSYYPDSDLDIAITSIYNNIKSAAGNAIQLTSLTTYGYYGKDTDLYNHSEYLFPLATTVSTIEKQNFLVETYLTTTTKRDFNSVWWLRTGLAGYKTDAYIIDGGGNIAYDPVYWSNDVRPAFVLKI